MRRGALLALALALLAGPGAAQSRDGLEPLDRRGDLFGWEGVGRIETPGGLCTGTLVATDVVLTAAHCVDDLPDSAVIRFRAGYRGGRSIADRRVTRTVIHEGWKGGSGDQLNVIEIPNDLALLKLDAPIYSSEADAFRVLTRPSEGDRVSVLSYGRGREEVLSRQAECRITDRFANGVLGFNCNVTFGSSGAPVFIREDGRLRIVSLISGGGNGAAYGAELAGRVAPLMARLRREGSQPRPSEGARRITIGGNGSDRPEGAKFIKP